jgi:urea transport system ATP-binding protein
MAARIAGRDGATALRGTRPMSAVMSSHGAPAGTLHRDGTLPRAEQILRVENLTVSFDGFKAVDDLSLSVDHNELRVIIGPNGAGKTTLLDIICGKTRPTSGRVLFNGIDLTRLAEHKIVRVGVGRKFQTPSVYEDLTVLENFEISLPHMHGLFQSLTFRRRPEVMARVEEMAAQVMLRDQLARRAGQLSHGQKQWLEIGMLLIQEPELVLLDEPVAGMSPREREQTGELLQRISAGKSVVVIEHDMDFVKRIAHKVTVLHQGKLLSEGTVEQVHSDPRVIDVYLGQ